MKPLHRTDHADQIAKTAPSEADATVSGNVRLVGLSEQEIAECMKDGGSEGAVVVSKLDAIEVGKDADELPITSCVVVPTEAIAEVRKGNKPQPKNQQTMLTLLEVAGKEGLLLSEWNEKAKAQGIGVKRHASLYDAQQALKQAKLAHSYAERWYANSSTQ